MPIKKLKGRTPFEAWTGKVPNVEHLRVFGCRVIFRNGKVGKDKLESRGEEGIFLGCSEESKAYRIWSPLQKRVLVSRDVKFLDEAGPKAIVTNDVNPSIEEQPKQLHYPFVDIEISNPKTPNLDLHDDGIGEIPFEIDSNAEERRHGSVDDPFRDAIDLESLGENEEDDSTTIDGEHLDNIAPAPQGPTRGPGRPRIVRSGSRGRPKKVYQPTVNLTAVVGPGDLSFLSEVPMKEAMAGCDVKEWRDAMAREIRAMIKNDTWILVDRPQNQKVVGSRIVLRNKLDSSGNIERRKARLVAQGFSQQPGIHFHETFAPVARISTIRLVASIAAERGMTIRQFDVETAYLNGELVERVYMETPKSIDSILQDIVDSESETLIKRKATDMLNEIREGDKVCLLKKSLYGLRQAGRNWHRKLSTTLMELGASPSKSDPCLYLIGSGKDLMFITIYVDDLLIAARNEKSIIELGKKLAKRFTMKDLGKARYCLGIEIIQEDGKISMHQREYTREIIDRFGMSDCKPVTTPMDIGTKLRKNETPERGRPETSVPRAHRGPHLLIKHHAT